MTDPHPSETDRSDAEQGEAGAARASGGERLHLKAGGGWRQRHRLAARDLAGGLRAWRLAATLGWLDITLRYRGSALGPFWLTLSSAIMVAAMGYIYGSLFHIVLRDYLPFLAVSLILWNSGIGAVAGDACLVFTQSEQTIRSMRMPFTIQVLRAVVRNLLVMAHNIVVPLAVFVIYGVWPGWTGLLALPGFGLWLIDAIGLCYLLGGVCARFRDVPPIVGSLVQIAFYITPVVWKPAQLGRHGWWLPFNPFGALLHIVRAPLLGYAPSPRIWAIALGYSALLWLAGWLMFARTRARLAFWV
jgi:lipopolysaccharide transport system permease protein